MPPSLIVGLRPQVMWTTIAAPAFVISSWKRFSRSVGPLVTTTMLFCLLLISFSTSSVHMLPSPRPQKICEVFVIVSGGTASATMRRKWLSSPPSVPMKLLPT